MLVYGTGAKLSYADRKAVKEIAAAARSGHGLRSIVRAVVSPSHLSSTKPLIQPSHAT
jgi:hypothetical protein